MPVSNKSVFNVKVGAFNQEKALVVVHPTDAAAPRLVLSRYGDI